MRKYLLILTVLSAVLLMGCEGGRVVERPGVEKGEVEQKKQEEEKTELEKQREMETREHFEREEAAARSRVLKETTWKSAENLQNKNIIASFEYTDELFSPKENGEWIVKKEYWGNEQESFGSEFYGFWKDANGGPPSFGQKPVFKYKVKEHFNHVSGPLIDRKNEKVYLQFREWDREGSMSLEDMQKLNVFWSYDFKTNKNTIQRNDSDTVLTTVDSNGLVHGTGGRGDACWSATHNNAYAGDSFGKEDESMREDTGYGCSDEVNYSLKVNGKSVISISNHGFETVGDPSVPGDKENTYHEVVLGGTKSKKVPYSEYRSVEGEIYRYTPVVIASLDHDGFAFTYFDSIILASVSKDKITTIQDPKLLEIQERKTIEGEDYQDPVKCWDQDNYFFFNPTQNKTLKVSAESESFEILNGNQIPEGCGSTADDHFSYNENSFPTNPRVTGLDW